MARFLLFGLLIAARCPGADPPPEFPPQGVVRGISAAVILVPGANRMSIFGRYLGPFGGCIGGADRTLREPSNPGQTDLNGTDNLVYPNELCGVQVFIGDKPAGLLYVSEKQINFKVPLDTRLAGSAGLRVVYKGQSSRPLAMKVGFYDTTVALEQPAYVGMPVWLSVDTPSPWGPLPYPSDAGPAGFGCNQVEARRNGVALVPNPGSDWARYGGSFVGPACGSYGPADRWRRLPLHLLFRFDEPGTYEVRYTRWDQPLSSPRASIQLRSEWTPIEILPAQPNQRAEFLNALRIRAPSDATEVMADTLPKVMGFPDQASLEILTGYLYHPDPSVRHYALRGLFYWPDDSIRRLLLGLVNSKGPSDEINQFLIQRADDGQKLQTEIAQSSLPNLESDSPVLIEGSLAALRRAIRNRPEFLEAVLKSAEHIMPLVNRNDRNTLAQMMAETKDPRVPVLLRKLFEEGYQEPVAGSLASFKDPSDLPKLAPLPTEDEARNDSWIGSSANLYRNYGAAAIPYLEAALSVRTGRFTGRGLAQQLMAAGSAAGFRFAAQALERGGTARIDFLQALKSQFPELKDGNDAAVEAFVKQRAAEH